MRIPAALSASILIAASCLCLEGQAPPSSASQIELKGMPPRAAPSDYQAQARAGAVTIAAEFKGHAIPPPEAPLTTEEYVVVEVGLFGEPGARTTISSGDFSLRINGKKEPLPSEPYGLVLASVKDPEYEPPKPAAKSKTNIGGGDRQDDGGPPAPVKIPIELQRAMAKRVQKATLAEGDRALPQAGLIYFPYRGKTQRIRSLELIYAGSAGKAAFPLQP